MGDVFCCLGQCQDEAKDETDGGKGERLKHDRAFKGPIRGKARRPKDLLCLGLFLLFIIVLMAIGIYSWVEGEPKRIVYPTDSRGRLCGVHEDVKHRPYLLFFDLTQCLTVVSLDELISGDYDTSDIFTCPTQQVCVDECPEENEFGVRDNPICVEEVDTRPYANLTGVDLDDLDSVETTAFAIKDLLNEIAAERCAPYYLDSTAVARRCIPTLVDLDDGVQELFDVEAAEEIQAAANSSDDANIIEDFGDLVYTVNVESIVNGSFTQALLVNVRQFLLDVYQDFEVVWPALIIGVVVTLIIAFTYIFLMRWFAGVIIWTGIILSLLTVLAISVFSWYQWVCLQDTSDIFDDFDPNDNDTTVLEFLNKTEELKGQICLQTEVFRQWVDTQLPWFKYQEETWLALAILGTVFLVVLIVILIFLGRRIRISIQIIKEASKAVGGVPTSVFYPVVTWVLLISLLIYWALVALFLVTAAERTYAIVMNASIPEGERNLTEIGLGVVSNGTTCDQEEFIDAYRNITLFATDENTNDTKASLSCMFNRFEVTNFLLGIQIYHFFGLLWIGNYILALGECTLAGAFASWYWAWKKPKDVPRFAVVESFGRAVLFHSGSLAFGSLIIAIIQLIRIILAYIKRKLKGKTGRVAKALLCMLSCCFWCLEKILRYVNRQAYIEIAIYGYDFCTAGCKAVKLLLRNIIITAVKDRIVGFLLFLGKVAIVGLIAIIAYLGFGPYEEQGRPLWGRPLNYYLIPVMFLTLTAYFIASGFMSIYSMAVDTIYICALEDQERNDGTDEHPYFMSKKLMKLLNVKNRLSDEPDAPIQMESLESVANDDQ